MAKELATSQDHSFNHAELKPKSLLSGTSCKSIGQVCRFGHTEHTAVVAAVHPVLVVAAIVGCCVLCSTPLNRLSVSQAHRIHG